MRRRPLMRTIVQIIDPANKQHLAAVGISETNVVCINQLRMHVAAQVRRGLPTQLLLRAAPLPAGVRRHA